MARPPTATAGPPTTSRPPAPTGRRSRSAGGRCSDLPQGRARLRRRARHPGRPGAGAGHPAPSGWAGGVPAPVRPGPNRPQRDHDRPGRGLRLPLRRPARHRHRLVRAGAARPGAHRRPHRRLRPPAAAPMAAGAAAGDHPARRPGLHRGGRRAPRPRRVPSLAGAAAGRRRGRDRLVPAEGGPGVSLLELCAVVFTYNAMTFGNGPGMVPLLQADLVDRRGVLSSQQLLYAFTIARVTPGQANTYVAAIGYMLHGLAGALATTAAIQLPGYLMLPLLWGYQRLGAVPLVPAFTRGLTVASVGLIFAATVSIGQSTLTGWVSLAVFAAALAMTQLLKWNPLVVLAVSTLLGTGAWVLGWV